MPLSLSDLKEYVTEHFAPPLRPKTALHEPIGLSNVSSYSGYRTECNGENRIALSHIVSEYYAFEVSTMLQLAPSIQNIENVITSPIGVRSSKYSRHRTQVVISNIYSKFEPDRTEKIFPGFEPPFPIRHCMHPGRCILPIG